MSQRPGAVEASAEVWTHLKLLKRITIAEACGYQFGPYGGHERWYNLRLGEGEQAVVGSNYALPDYLHCLNAMHEAEKELDASEYYDYTGILSQTKGGFSATAAERAEAFLLIIGKRKP